MLLRTKHQVVIEEQVKFSGTFIAAQIIRIYVLASIHSIEWKEGQSAYVNTFYQSQNGHLRINGDKMHEEKPKGIL